MSRNGSVEAVPNDADLIAACREGRTEAFGTLVERYQDRAYNLAYRLTGSRDDASEAVQEAFLKAYRGIHNFRGDSAFYSWLFRITVNVVRSRLRFQAVRPKEVRLETAERSDEYGTDRAVSGMAADVEDPAETASRVERQRFVEDALRRMDPEQRMIIVLRDLEGHDYARIADLLECPRGTVKSRVHRARMALKKALAPVLAEDEEAAP